MELRSCINALMRWAISRLGEPGRYTTQPPREVFAPSPTIPSVYSQDTVLKTVAMARYPLESEFGIDIHRLWNAYEIVLSDVANGLQVPVYRALSVKLGIPSPLGLQLFGGKLDTPEQQMGEAAVRIALMVHYLWGSRLSEDHDGFSTKLGSADSFGIINGCIASRFTRGVKVNLPAIFANFENTGHSLYTVSNSRLLNLYYLADLAGDPAVTYILDTLIWISRFRLKGASESIIDIATRGKPTSINGQVRVRGREVRLHLSDAAYAQGLYICRHSLNPKITLARLLVPDILSAKDYTVLFTNQYVGGAATPLIREKLIASLDALKAQGPELADEVSNFFDK